MDAIDGQLFHIADVTFIGVDPDLVSIVIFGGRDPISIVIDFCAILFVVCGEVTAQCSNNGSKSWFMVFKWFDDEVVFDGSVKKLNF